MWVGIAMLVSGALLRTRLPAVVAIGAGVAMLAGLSLYTLLVYP